MTELNLGSVLKILLDFLHFIKYFEQKSHKREWDSTKNNYSNKLSRKKRMSEEKVVNTLLLLDNWTSVTKSIIYCSTCIMLLMHEVV